MNICLVGAPGAGKSQLALDIVDTIGQQAYAIIDGYAETVGDKTHLALGLYAGYTGNLLIAAERLSREVGCIKRDEPYVVCGSLVETIAYYSLNTSTRPSLDEQRRIGAMMAAFGVLAGDHFNYEVTLFLPLPEDHEDAWLSREINSALDILGVPYARLHEDERLDQALAIIDNATKGLEAAKALQSGVREGGDDGGEERREPNDVPNLSGHGSDGIGQ